MGKKFLVGTDEEDDDSSSHHTIIVDVDEDEQMNVEDEHLEDSSKIHRRFIEDSSKIHLPSHPNIFFIKLS